MIKNINCFLWKFVVKDILYSLGGRLWRVLYFDFSLIKSVQIPFVSEPMHDQSRRFLFVQQIGHVFHVRIYMFEKQFESFA